MKRLAALLLVAACAAAEPPEAGSAGADVTGDIPFANAPGTIYAPRAAPTPILRGGFQAAVETPSKGGVCNDPRLVGETIAPITSSRAGCGIAKPVSITAVSGVALSQPIRVGCGVARALADWTEQSAKPAAARSIGAALTRMNTVASYSCRTRNSRPGARLSEHAKGNAVDIAGFSFAGGQEVSVLRGWDGTGRHFLRQVWRDACGPFGTVLGPDSDRFHRDHFHLDVARHFGGPYCR